MIVILLLIAFNNVYSQAYIDIVSIRKSYSPDVGLHSNNSKVNTTEYLFSGINLPINYKNYILVISPFYENWNINTYDSLNFNLKGVGIPVTLTKQFSDKWSFSTTLFFRNNSSDLFENFSNQLGTLTTINYTVNSKLKIKPGIYFNKEFWGNFILPIVAIDYSPNDKLRVWGNLPATLFIEKKLNKHWYCSFILRGINNSYTLNKNEYTHVNETQIGVVSDWYIGKNFVLAFEAGHSFFRKIRTGNMYLEKSFILDDKMRNNTYFRISTSYRIRLK